MQTKSHVTLIGIAAETSFETLALAVDVANSVEALHKNWGDSEEALVRLVATKKLRSMSNAQRSQVLYVLRNYWTFWSVYGKAFEVVEQELKEKGRER